MRYSALFQPDSEAGGYVVTFPDFGYGVTQGETVEQAYDMAQDLLECLVGNCIDAGKELPKPVERRAENWHMVRLPVLADAKAELYTAFLKSGMSKSELSRRTAIKEANINRLFRLDHKSRLDQLQAAFRALGLELTIEVHGVERGIAA
jgi:antitoxin HicB